MDETTRTMFGDEIDRQLALEREEREKEIALERENFIERMLSDRIPPLPSPSSLT